jgi:hypothetical protein
MYRNNFTFNFYVTNYIEKVYLRKTVKSNL